MHAFMNTCILACVQTEDVPIVPVGTWARWGWPIGESRLCSGFRLFNVEDSIANNLDNGISLSWFSFSGMVKGVTLGDQTATALGKTAGLKLLPTCLQGAPEFQCSSGPQLATDGHLF